MIPVSNLIIQKPKDMNTIELRSVQTADHQIQVIVVSKHSGKAYYVMIEMDEAKLSPKSKVRIACTCDDFKFRWAAVLHKKGALLHPNRFDLRPPKVTNPSNIVACCKHVQFTFNEALIQHITPLSHIKGQI